MLKFDCEIFVSKQKNWNEKKIIRKKNRQTNRTKLKKQKTNKEPKLKHENMGKCFSGMKKVWT